MLLDLRGIAARACGLEANFVVDAAPRWNREALRRNSSDVILRFWRL